MIRISIVIPSFNQGEYLEQAIRSVLLQGYPDVELIVVDGASKDSSLDVIQKYADRLAWWVSELDQGQSHAINKGFARCTGDIITFLSSDDYYLPGTFQDVVERINENPHAGAIVGGFSFLDEGQAQPGEAQRPVLNGGSPVDLSLGPPGKYRLHQVATFYTRHALDAVGRNVREDMKYVMDRELLYRICRSFPVLLSEKNYGVFRRHAESKSVASILPFAREFAQLYRLHCNGDRAQDSLRRGMARYRLARGCVKYAYVAGSFGQAVWALIQSAWNEPGRVLRSRYWKHWLFIFRNRRNKLYMRRGTE